jgi:glycosyltransferase involved in cell wall biosynthesis
LSYVLITPIKNEKENLPQLKTAILNQTLLPVVWVIVDSGSTDGSFDLAEDLFHGCEWIKIIHQRTFCGQGHTSQNMSEAINEGYERANKECSDNHANYSFVGKTDATPILRPDYFETLHEEMEKDRQLAFTCGIERLKYRGKVKEVRPTGSFSNTGYNDIRLYKKQFFEEIGGYPLAPFPDGCLQLKAANRGWKYGIVERTNYEKPRLGGAKSGVWHGYKTKGSKMYVLGYHPLLLVLHAIHSSVKFPPHYQFGPIALGYLSSAVRREKQVDDDELKKYFGRERLYELLSDLLSSFKT